MIVEVQLDPQGENSPTEGFIEIRDELAFLKSLRGSARLFVKGVALCDWVAEVARARQWQYSWQSAPSVELVNLCPGLTQETAKLFLHSISDLNQLRRPLSILDVGVARWSAIDPSGKMEMEQAWSWLSWRSHYVLQSFEESVVLALGESFSVTVTPDLRPFFRVQNAMDAWLLMRRWLRCESSDMDLPSCPVHELPSWAIERLRCDWKLRAIQTQGKFFKDLVDLQAPRFVLQIAAPIAYEFFRSNPLTMTSELMTSLKTFLSSKEWQFLQDLLPSMDPGPIPTTLAELFAWYSDRYLPFRLRRPQASENVERVRSIGREFGLWYLRFYSNARAGAVGGKLLSWNRTAELAAKSTSVNLLVVLDGLGFADAQQTIQFISAEASRLALDFLETILAPLPTITRFAKPALMAGVNPSQAFDEAEIGRIQTRDTEVIKALDQAIPGTVVIWSLMEPDKTYHTGLDEETIQSEVSGRLRSIAQRISRIVREVTARQMLRIVITTDHGRLLSTSRRAREVPPNMKAHGRAAWGKALVPFDSDGIYVDGDIAYIEPLRFGLIEPSAIMLSDDAFLTSDGRSGIETFPHGGVFPEEVLIPWIQFTRDRAAITLSLNITGRGISGSSGKLRLEVINTNEVAVEVIELTLTAIDLQIETNITLGPLKKEAAEWSVSRWPEKKLLSTVKARVTYVLPNGERQTAEVIPLLTAEEMYSRNTTLDDLF